MKTLLLAKRLFLFLALFLSLPALALAESRAIVAVGGGSDAPIMLKIIFWILLLLWAIGVLGWHDNPNVVRGSNLLLIILFAILGFYTFGF